RRASRAAVPDDGLRPLISRADASTLQPVPSTCSPERGGTMRRFQARVVEVYSEFEGILTVHFDEGQEQYLQFQAAAEGYEDEYPGVYVEIDDQHLGDHDCFSLAELRRGSFRLVFQGSAVLDLIGEIEVAFELDDAAFTQLRQGLERVFRSVASFYVEVA